MKIILCSYAYPPSIGGIESVSKLLAECFVALGVSVTVVTATKHDSETHKSSSIVVLRCKGFWELRKIGRAADLIFQNNLSLRLLAPFLFLRKPIVVAHHTWITRVDGTAGMRDRLKQWALRYFVNVSPSEALSQALPVRSVVIRNPFDLQEFRHARNQVKGKDIVFMGRLVSDKGCEVFLNALGILAQRGLTAQSTIVGDGPNRRSLVRQAIALGLSKSVHFVGSIVAGRGEIVGQHKILVVPSVWAEPFGLVALEGIAAGCVIVASNTGGLPEAVGKCGVLVRGNEPKELADALEKLLEDKRLRQELLSSAESHLKNFIPMNAAKRYKKLFAKIILSGMA